MIGFGIHSDARTIALSDGRVVRLNRAPYLSGSPEEPTWTATGYLVSEDPGQETGPTVCVCWESLGSEEGEDDADWEAPYSVYHYALGQLLPVHEGSQTSGGGCER